MIATATEAPITITIPSLARRAVDETETIEDARERMIELADEHGLTDELASLGARTAVHECRHNTRVTIRKMPDPCTRDASVIASVACVAEQTILDTWRCGDKALGDLTGLDIDAEIEAALRLEEGHRTNRTFYSLLRRRVGDNQTVRSRVKPAQAAKMYESASKETAQIAFAPESAKPTRSAGPTK